MNPTLELAALDSERETLLTKANTTPSDFTAEDAERAETVVKRMGELKEQMAKSKAAVDRLTSAGLGKSQDKPADEDDAPVLKGGLGDRFVASRAMKEHRKSYPLGIDGKPVSIKTEGLGTFIAAKASGDPDPLSSSLGGARQYQREAGIVDLTYPKKPTLLDFITTDTTEATYLEYRQLLAVTNNADVVPENTLKPLSNLTTGLAQAVAHVIADGFKVTNQELADDGVMRALLNSVLTRNLLTKIEDLILNGTGTNEPRGILQTTGVLAQTFSVDIVQTIRKAITHLEESSETTPTLVLLNPRDAEKVDLLQDTTDRYLGSGPFNAGPSTLWGIPRSSSSKIPEGKALIGDLSSVHLLERDAVKVEVFNQNEDDARFNRAYVRAETRQMLLVREPARLCVAALTGA